MRFLLELAFKNLKEDVVEHYLLFPGYVWVCGCLFFF